MYLPPAFNEPNYDKLHPFMEQNSFAMLVSRSAGQLVANHLPMLLDSKCGPHGCLYGHMARANTQWQHAEGTEVLVVFSGPHAYISPTWYEAAHVVPTWNYVAVHAYGMFHAIQER